jgi:hypothetical protein
MKINSKQIGTGPAPPTVVHADLWGGRNPRGFAISYLVGLVYGKLLFKLALINL